MLAVGRDNVALTEYLVGQVLESDEKRFSTLSEFFPNVKGKTGAKRWPVSSADYQGSAHGGILQLGTEIVSAADRLLQPCWAPRPAPPPQF